MELEIPDVVAELWQLLAQIPRGRVTTYGDLAEALGDLTAARWVAEEMLHHRHSGRCPCHRVVRRTGELGQQIGGQPEEKVRRLRREGIAVDDGRLDLERHRFSDFRSGRPLAKLAEYQRTVPERVRFTRLATTPRRVAAVDVAYPRGGEAVGAYVLFNAETDQTLWSTTVRQPVRFPYITGYLAFREIPVHLELLREARQADALAALLLVDGSGVLHPRRGGIAAHLGVLTERPTIGVSKKLLCGQVDLAAINVGRPAPILFREELLGMAVRASEVSRPIFVSPGNRITVPDAARAVTELFRGHRLPEPIHLADALSRREARRAGA